jgi:putative hemolysin
MLLQIALVVLLAVLNGFFALSEMALMVARRSRLKHLALTSRRAKVGGGRAQQPANLQETLEVLITRVQVGAGA